jgi:hypothetical protein
MLEIKETDDHKAEPVICFSAIMSSATTSVLGGRVGKPTVAAAKKQAQSKMPGKHYYIFHVNSCAGIVRLPSGTTAVPHAYKSGVLWSKGEITRELAIKGTGVPPDQVTGLTLVEITPGRYEREQKRLANKGADHKDWLFPL